MSDITLSASIRTALLTTQRTTALADTKRENLATGFNVNNPAANPSAFFAARSLSNRANDLLAAKDNIGGSAGALGSTFAGIDALGKTVDQLKAVLESARGGTAADRGAAAPRSGA
ncbi:MAG: flagellar protein, partial [Proteobacteria bacterium]|nr:flagellar protein [Pseudomonadota bacterium]